MNRNKVAAIGITVAVVLGIAISLIFSGDDATTITEDAARLTSGANSVGSVTSSGVPVTK